MNNPSLEQEPQHPLFKRIASSQVVEFPLEDIARILAVDLEPKQLDRSMKALVRHALLRLQQTGCDPNEYICEGYFTLYAKKKYD
jgi:hypothetical protein